MLGLVTGAIGLVFKYLGAKNDADAAKALEEIKALVQANAEKSAIVRAQLGHPIAWVPRFLIELGAALYIGAIFIDSVFDLPGAVLALPTNEAALLGVIVSGMFISTAFRSSR